MPSTTTDAQLVADHLAGARAALATIYDRYGATLHDTAAAMSRSRDEHPFVELDRRAEPADRIGNGHRRVAATDRAIHRDRPRRLLGRRRPGRASRDLARAVSTDLDGDGDPDDGRWTWVIEANDAFGNTGRATGVTTIVPTFC